MLKHKDLLWPPELWRLVEHMNDGPVMISQTKFCSYGENIFKKFKMSRWICNSIDGCIHRWFHFHKLQLYKRTVFFILLGILVRKRISKYQRQLNFKIQWICIVRNYVNLCVFRCSTQFPLYLFIQLLKLICETHIWTWAQPLHGLHGSGPYQLLRIYHVTSPKLCSAPVWIIWMLSTEWNSFYIRQLYRIWLVDICTNVVCRCLWLGFVSLENVQLWRISTIFQLLVSPRHLIFVFCREMSERLIEWNLFAMVLIIY